METYKWVIFLVILLLILAVIDFYVLRSWTKYVKERKWNNLYYKAPWIFGAIIFLIYSVSIIYRANNNVPDSMYLALYLLTSIWYLPKIVIAPVLLFKDIFRQIIRLFKKVFLNKNTPVINEKTDRRKFLQTAGWALSGVPFIMVSHGAVNTTHDFTLYDVDLQLDKMDPSTDGFKIIQLSDLHAGGFISSKPMGRAREIINSINPDLIVITGDFVNFSPDEMKIISSELKLLRSKNGVFACLGNHDHYMKPEDHDKLISEIRNSDIVLMNNENSRLNLNGQLINLIGVDNINKRQSFGDLDIAMNGIDNDIPTVLMCHDPVNWEPDIQMRKNIDLTLSGHTHGGQFAVELMGEYLSPVRIFSKYYAGLYSNGNQHLYVNRGIGTTGPPVRVGVPPEITLFNIKSNSIIS